MKRSILFLCTGNSCRSQMAEALLKHLGGGRFEALSAGSHPAGYVHDLAMAAMSQLGIIVVNARSKSWDEFMHARIDAVITLCDDAANETCPVWPGEPVQAHWPLPDPAFHPGSDDERLAFAVQVASRLRLKIEGLLGVDFDGDRAEVEKHIRRLGEI